MCFLSIVSLNILNSKNSYLSIRKALKSRQYLMATQRQLLAKCFHQKINTFSSLGDFKSLLHKQNLAICVGNWPGNQNLPCCIWKAAKAVLTPRSCQDVIYSMFEHRHFQKCTGFSAPTFALLRIFGNLCSRAVPLCFRSIFLYLPPGTEILLSLI